MLGEFEIDLGNVGNVVEDYVGMYKLMLEYSRRLENVRNQLSEGSYGEVISTIQVIEQQLLNDCKSIEVLKETLLESIKIYTACENNLFSDGKDVVSLMEVIASATETGTADGAVVDSSQMTYEEYLQYRIDHAVDENTKMLYEKYLENINIIDDSYEGTARYNYTFNNIKYDESADAENPRGVGCTYFHETGHLIDDQSDLFGHTSNDGSYDFYEKLEQDVDNYVKKIMQEKGYTSEEKAYKEFTSWLKTDPDMKNGISDIVNGLTDGQATGNWSHSDNYYTEKKICREAFAHFFEAGMAAEPTKLDYIKEIFPSAYKEYQKMLEDELK